MSDPLLKLRAVAGRLGLSHRTVQRWVRSGRLPTVRTVSGYHRVRQSTLDALVPPETPRNVDPGSGAAAPSTGADGTIPVPDPDRRATGLL